jgi:uncharacterized protein (TIGR00251 family)
MLEEILKNFAAKKKVTFRVKITAGSSKNEIVGRYGDSLKIKIAAAPEKGKANGELVRFLAKTFNLPANRIRIVKGLSSPQKIIEISHDISK